MNKAPYLSIIIPIYRVEQYLFDCLNSILLQNSKDYEVLMIDDGSDDKSYEIMNHFSWLDKRFKSFHKENGGLSSARNTGLNKASGNYIMFLDGDDRFSCIFFKKIITMLKKYNPDILLFNGEKEDNNKINKVRKSFTSQSYKSGKDYINYSISSFEWIPMVWLGAYKRKFLEQNNIKFKIGRIHEDDFFSIEVLKTAETLITVDECWYHYNIHQGSIMKTKTNEDSFISFSEVALFVHENYTDNKNEVILWLIRRYVLSAYKHFYCLSLDERNKLFEKMERFSKIAILYLKADEKQLAIKNNFFSDMCAIASEKWYEHISHYNT